MRSTDRQHAAIHEAGHAVAHVRLGLGSREASIAHQPGTLERHVGAGTESVWLCADAERQVVAFCCGYAACVASGDDHDTAEQAAWDDFAQAEQLIAFWVLEGRLTDWQARAVAFMQQPENVRAVERVADELLRRETLDADWIEVLVRVADGETTEAEYQAYLRSRGESTDGK